MIFRNLYGLFKCASPCSITADLEPLAIVDSKSHDVRCPQNRHAYRYQRLGHTGSEGSKSIYHERSSSKGVTFNQSEEEHPSTARYR